MDRRSPGLLPVTIRDWSDESDDISSKQSQRQPPRSTTKKEGSNLDLALTNGVTDDEYLRLLAEYPPAFLRES